MSSFVRWAGLLFLGISFIEGFNVLAPSLNGHHSQHRKIRESTTVLSMGIFDGFKNAFSNEAFSAPPEGIKATARHILVKNTDDANMIIGQLGSGDASFADLARQYSTCPSGSSGGSLGSFGPGTMVKEFDQVIFSPETNLGEVVGPVETKFGYHLIVVDKRTGV